MGIALGAYQNAAKKNGLLAVSEQESVPDKRSRIDYISYVCQRAVYWPERIASLSADAISNFLEGLLRAGSLSKKVSDLETLVSQKTASQQQIQQLLAENARLRALLDLPKPPKTYPVTGDVIGYFPSEHKIMLNVGKGRRIAPGAPVISADGLLGQVVEVSPTSCFVNLVTHPDFSVGARVQRNESQEAGIASGQSGRELRLNLYNESADVKIGDKIVTSGLSLIYPEGLPVGTVTNVWSNKDLGIRQALVAPAADFAKIRQVVVLVR